MAFIFQVNPDDNTIAQTAPPWTGTANAYTGTWPAWTGTDQAYTGTWPAWTGTENAYTGTWPQWTGTANSYTGTWPDDMITTQKPLPPRTDKPAVTTRRYIPGQARELFFFFSFQLSVSLFSFLKYIIIHVS